MPTSPSIPNLTSPQALDLGGMSAITCKLGFGEVQLYSNTLCERASTTVSLLKTYKLTEEKWASIDAIWRKNNETTIGRTVDSGSDAFATLKHTTFWGRQQQQCHDQNPFAQRSSKRRQISSVGRRGHRWADGTSCGPVSTHTPSKKAKLFKFFTEKFPVGLRS